MSGIDSMKDERRKLAHQMRRRLPDLYMRGIRGSYVSEPARILAKDGLSRQWHGLLAVGRELQISDRFFEIEVRKHGAFAVIN